MCEVVVKDIRNVFARISPIKAEKVSELLTLFPVEVSGNGYVSVLTNIHSLVGNSHDYPIGVMGEGSKVLLFKMNKYSYSSIMGEWFGYPKCCTVEFNNSSRDRRGVKKNFQGTGFVPCTKCNLLPMKELSNTINSNRLCETPFLIKSNHLADMLGIIKLIKRDFL